MYERITLSNSILIVHLRVLGELIYIFSSNCIIKVSKGAKIRNRYNQVPHLTQDINTISTIISQTG